ncbi:MAG: hypothetical protein D6731_25855, partial [Planctomycetota bacterium]
MKPTSLCLALLCAGAPLASAQTASHPVGIEVDVPEGYAWKQGYRYKPSTVIYLEGTAPEAHPPAIIVNAIDMGREVPSEDLFRQTREVFADLDGQAEEVELPNGRYLRVDFQVQLAEKGGTRRTVRQRCYARMHGRTAFYFFLANLEPERFARAVTAFDALVAGARFEARTGAGSTDPESRPAAASEAAPAREGEAAPAREGEAAPAREGEA